MKPWFPGLLVAVALAVPLGADSVLVNTLDSRALVGLKTPHGVVTRDLEPGQRLEVDARFLSGMGEKDLVLGSGVVYLARFGALPRFYRLGTDQVLIVNQSRLALVVTLADRVSGVLANGAPALGALEGGRLEVQWGDARLTLTQPGLYRFVADDGGTALRPWAD